jgi:hypothetical protein
MTLVTVRRTVSVWLEGQFPRMNIKRLCILLLLSMTAWVFVGEPPAQVTPPPSSSSTEPASLVPRISDPDDSDPDLSGFDPSNEGDSTFAELSADSTIVGHTLSQGTGSASIQTAQVSRVDFGLEEIVASIEKVLPPTWQVATMKRRQVPRRWLGPADAVLIGLEDRSMVVHHTRGFEYHPFYKLWLCPPTWQGSMENVTIQGDEGPSVLLGINHGMKVFYLTLGANTWPKGPEILRKTLDLTALSITASLKQIIDSSMRIKLFQRVAPTESSSPGLLVRVVGMENDGPLAYLEYASVIERETDGFSLPSKCEEPRVASLAEKESRFLAGQIFSSYPDVKTVCVRRLCDQFFSDRIIDRPDRMSALQR